MPLANNTLEAGENLKNRIYHKLIYGKSRNTIFHLVVALPGGSVFFGLQAKKTDRANFIQTRNKQSKNNEGGKKWDLVKC
mgnify:CR=1 FL=1